MKRLLADPLLRFLIIGACVFGAYALWERDVEPERDAIVVSSERADQLAAVFVRTWQRPPTPAELRGLVDAYVREEIYYREAQKLGLDRDDTIVRRRLQQKLEFLIEPGASDLAPSDAELTAFMAASDGAYSVPPTVGFEQIQLDDDRIAELDPQGIIERLNQGADEVVIEAISRPSLLPSTTAPVPLTQVARNFGQEFADRLADLPVDRWAGPVRSAYGKHLVRITDFTPAYEPPLDEVRAAVERDWLSRARRDYQDQAYNAMRGQYEIVLPDLRGDEPVRETSR